MKKKKKKKQKELISELLKECKNPEEILGKNGVLKDDSPKYYNKVIYTVNRGKSNYCVITITKGE